MTVSKNAMGVSAVSTPSMKSMRFSRAPPLQDLSVGCPRDLLDREMSLAVIADGVDRDAVTLVELGVVFPQGAQDHGVAGPGGQQVVHFPPHAVVAADS